MTIRRKVIPLWLTPAGFTGKFHLSIGEITCQVGFRGAHSAKYSKHDTEFP